MTLPARKINLVLALLFPIIILASWVLSKEIQQHRGREVVLPILPYDPFNLLSGHYLSYSVDYGITDYCQKKQTKQKINDRQSMQLCLLPQRFWFDKNSTHQPCELFITGYCKDSRFIAGIEQYYVSEARAAALEKAVRQKQAKIRILVTPEGTAQVTDLFIE